MDLFGRKRIAELERENAQLRTNYINESKHHQVEEATLRREAEAARNQVEYLVRTIRDMDQEIWNMAQKIDWPAQRPHFVKLQEGMTARKVAESNRIADILRPELISTYNNQTNTPKRLK